MDKKLDDYSSAEIAVFRIRWLVECHQKGIKDEFLNRLIIEQYNKKLKEERDKKYSDQQVKEIVETWLKYMQEKSLSPDITQDIDTIFYTVIDSSDNQQCYALNNLTDPKLVSLTIYSLLRCNYKVYKANILACHCFEDNITIEENKSYKDYLKEYKNSHEHNQNMLNKVVKAFKRDCSFEKAKEKFKEWLTESARPITSMFLPADKTEYTIVILDNQNTEERKMFELKPDEYLYNKIIWYLHKLDYNIVILMKINNLLVYEDK